MRNTLRKKLLTICTTAVLVLPFIASAAYADKLIMATEGAFPPFNSINAAGELVGFDVEIGLALCEKMGAECEVVAQDWDGIIPELIASKYDFVIASMFITEERKKLVAFTDPYYLSAIGHVVPKDSDIKEFTAESLDGKIIGVQSGTTHASYIEQSFPNSEIRLYPTQDEVKLDMAAGQLDMTVGDILPMLDWTKKAKDGECCELRGDLITDSKYVGEGVGIALRHEDEELRNRLNKALLRILVDGTYKAINDKYFDLNIYTMK